MRHLLKRYSLVDIIGLAIYKLVTPFYFPKARLVRLPIQVRGKQFMRVGSGFTTGKYCRLEVVLLDNLLQKNTVLQIGDNVQINDNVHIAAVSSIKIGDNVLIASKVFISDHSHGNYGGIVAMPEDSPLTAPSLRKLIVQPVEIKNNVWIGEFVSILPGVIIGEGSIVGTLSVVNRDVPPYCIVVGNPAKVIKKYCFDKQTWEKVPNR